MRERADRRLALTIGLLLAVGSLANDVLVRPPGFVARAVSSVTDVFNDTADSSPSPGSDVDRQDPGTAPVEGAITTLP